MDINVEIKNLEELVKAFEKAPGEAKIQLRLALRESLVKIQEHARKEHRFRTRTGMLERSVQVEVPSEWPLVGRVWLNPGPTQTASGLSYGVFQHEGTKDHPIEPRNKKALRWVGGDGAMWFSKGHDVSGIKSDPFIYRAGEANHETINRIFDRHIEMLIAKIANGGI